MVNHIYVLFSCFLSVYFVLCLSFILRGKKAFHVERIPVKIPSLSVSSPTEKRQFVFESFFYLFGFLCESGGGGQMSRISFCVGKEYDGINSQKVKGFNIQNPYVF